MTEPTGTTQPEPDPARLGSAVLAALGVAVLLIVTGAAVGVAMGMRGGAHTMMWGGPDTPLAPAAAATGDAGTQTAPQGFQLDGMAAHLVTHYEFARANPRVYEQIPCYCGCQQMLGHRNLEDCFVTPDGAWESHASGCQVCIDESEMVMRMMGRGMGPGMMHDRIVAAYENPIAG